MLVSFEALRPDAERLTVESAKNHVELLEVRQSATLRRDSAGELMRSVTNSAHVEHLE